MKLSDIKKAIKKFSSAQERGKQLKAKKIRKVMAALEKKQSKFESNYAGESSSKARQKLKRKLKIVKAQIKKARRILRDLES